MGKPELNLVTGAFGYSGKYITRRLLAMGKQVITLTGNPERPDPFAGQVKAYPFNFNEPEELVSYLKGAVTLYNTYWVRFSYGQINYHNTIQNTRTLLQAAKSAGIQRMVHVSITNPSIDSPLPYFRGKALLEESIRRSGLSYAILRPTVIFGKEDILINNIAYLLRRFPFFVIPGSGKYLLQPIYVEDMADLAVQTGGSGENLILDAVGPDIFTFEEMVKLIGRKLNSRAMLIHLPPRIALFFSILVGYLLQDVVLTRDELNGLMAGLLVSEKPPIGKTTLSAWLEQNRDSVGVDYASELKRHFK